MVISVTVPPDLLVLFGYTLFGIRMPLKLYNIKKPRQKFKATSAERASHATGNRANPETLADSEPD